MVQERSFSQVVICFHIFLFFGESKNEDPMHFFKDIFMLIKRNEIPAHDFVIGEFFSIQIYRNRTCHQKKKKKEYSK